MKMLKKIILVIFLLSCLTLFFRCVYMGTSGEKAAYKINAAFIKALNEKDADGIKALLCEYTLETEDIDKQIERLFDFIDKSAFPIEKKDIFEMGTPGHSSYMDGQVTRFIEAHQRINAKNGKTYSVVICAYIECADPKKLGASEILVVNITDFPEGIEEYNKAWRDPENRCKVGKYIE